MPELMFSRFAVTRWDRAKQRQGWFTEPLKDCVYGLVAGLVALILFALFGISIKEVLVSIVVAVIVAVGLPFSERYYWYCRLPRIEAQELSERLSQENEVLKQEKSRRNQEHDIARLTEELNRKALLELLAEPKQRPDGLIARLLQTPSTRVPTKKEWGTLNAHFRKNPAIKVDADWEMDHHSAAPKWNVVLNRRDEDWFMTHAGEAGACAKRAGYVPKKFSANDATDNVDYWLAVVASRLKHLSDLENTADKGGINDVVAKSALVCAQFKTDAPD